MKTYRVVLAASLVLGLGACATTGEASQARATPSPASSLAQTDEAYVARVEQVARTRGIHVTWINTPRKHVRDN